MADGTVAVIGAGAAGLACAAALAEAGRPVAIFEKSGGLGGRMATRRSEASSFDHGAPGFTAADPAFAALTARAVAAGQAAPWPGGAAHLLARTEGPAYLGLPGASGFARALAAALPDTAIHRRATVTAIARQGGAWVLAHDAPDAPGPFSTLLLAIPAPQAASLLAGGPARFAPLDRVEMAPRITAMLALDTPLPPGAEAAAGGHPVIEKALRQSAFPHRAGPAENWVIHAAEAWSRANIEREKPDLAAALIAAFAEAAGPLPPERYRAGHRWRYALTARPAGQPCLWDPALRLGLCGDWCLGDTVEHAVLSGRALAAGALESVNAAHGAA
ncbi:MAG: FAD-dependent oxidoreductase [Pseudomonadota bacterium]